MTRKSLLCYLLFAVGVFAQAPAVTNITFDQVSHSVARVNFTSTGSWNAVLIRYVVSPTTCAGGTNGTHDSFFGVNGAGGIQASNSNGLVISGLTAGTTYQVCVDLSPNGGSTWVAGPGATLTTLSQLQNWNAGTGVNNTFTSLVHPALPIPPTTFDTSYPNTSGYTSVATLSDCSDLNSKWNTAVTNQLTTDTIINIPAGSVCTPSYTGTNNVEYGPTVLAPDVQVFGSSNVTTSTNQITLTGHGFTEGQQIVFGVNGSCLPGSDLTAYCGQQGRGPINLGSTYYAHVIDANNFQVYANAAAGAGGTLCTFSNTGSGSTMYVVKWPRPLHNIIIRTSAADSAFAPAGTRIGPAWAAKMVALVMPLGAIGVGSNTLVYPNGALMAANTRFVGIEFTYAANTYSASTSDPIPWWGLFATTNQNQNIVVDRCWFHGLGSPNRTYRPITEWDGKNVAIINSYIDGWEYFHSTYSGLAITNPSSHVITIAAGIHNMGSGPVPLASPVTVTLNGSGTANEAFVYFDMNNSNKLTISTPTGMSASCSGGSCVNVTENGGNGLCNYADFWPKDGNGSPTVGQIACFNLDNSANVTSITQADARRSQYDTEGCQCLIAGVGPGPWMVVDNYISAVGLPWHHDDGGGNWAIHGDYTYQRNHIVTPLTKMYGGPQSDGLTYFHRQPLEWKSGNRIQLFGNVFDGSWVEDNPTAVTVAFTSYLGLGGITDVDFENNTFEHVPGITQPPGVDGVNQVAVQPPPGARFLFRNNLAWDVNGYTYCVLGEGGCTTGVPGKGWWFQGPNQMEEMTVDHNTVVGNVGSAPILMYAGGTRVEGIQVTNNFMYLDYSFGVLPQGGQMSPACTSTGEAGANCAWTSYVWDHNVMIGGGPSQSQIQGAWPGHTSNNYIPSNMALSSVGWFNYQSPATVNGNPQNLDFHLKANYCAGCSGPGIGPAADHADVGANIDQLEAAQGKTTLGGVPASSITSSAASVAFVAPDSAGCSVDYSSSDSSLINNFTRIGDPGGMRARNISLSGLSSHTTYYYRVNCAVQQPTGQFRTN